MFSITESEPVSSEGKSGWRLSAINSLVSEMVKVVVCLRKRTHLHGHWDYKHVVHYVILCHETIFLDADAWRQLIWVRRLALMSDRVSYVIFSDQKMFQCFDFNMS